MPDVVVVGTQAYDAVKYAAAQDAIKSALHGLQVDIRPEDSQQVMADRLQNHALHLLAQAEYEAGLEGAEMHWERIAGLLHDASYALGLAGALGGASSDVRAGFGDRVRALQALAVSGGLGAPGFLENMFGETVAMGLTEGANMLAVVALMAATVVAPPVGLIGGALVGGTYGAVKGEEATGTVGGAVVGGLLGLVGGALAPGLATFFGGAQALENLGFTRAGEGLGYMFPGAVVFGESIKAIFGTVEAEDRLGAFINGLRNQFQPPPMNATPEEIEAYGQRQALAGDMGLMLQRAGFPEEIYKNPVAIEFANNLLILSYGVGKAGKAYAESPAFAARLAQLKALAEAYQRIPIRERAGGQIINPLGQILGESTLERVAGVSPEVAAKYPVAWRGPNGEILVGDLTVHNIQIEKWIAEGKISREQGLEMLGETGGWTKGFSSVEGPYKGWFLTEPDVEGLIFGPPSVISPPVPEVIPPSGTVVPPQVVPVKVGELEVKDTFQRPEGDRVIVAGKDAAGNVILKDGTTVTVPADATVPGREGSVVVGGALGFKDLPQSVKDAAARYGTLSREAFDALPAEEQAFLLNAAQVVDYFKIGTTGAPSPGQAGGLPDYLRKWVVKVVRGETAPVTAPPPVVTPPAPVVEPGVVLTSPSDILQWNEIGETQRGIINGLFQEAQGYGFGREFLDRLEADLAAAAARAGEAGVRVLPREAVAPVLQDIIKWLDGAKASVGAVGVPPVVPPQAPGAAGAAPEGIPPRSRTALDVVMEMELREKLAEAARRNPQKLGEPDTVYQQRLLNVVYGDTTPRREPGAPVPMTRAEIEETVRERYELKAEPIRSLLKKLGYTDAQIDAMSGTQARQIVTEHLRPKGEPLSVAEIAPSGVEQGELEAAGYTKGAFPSELASRWRETDLRAWNWVSDKAARARLGDKALPRARAWYDFFMKTLLADYPAAKGAEPTLTVPKYLDRVVHAVSPNAVDRAMDAADIEIYGKVQRTRESATPEGPTVPAAGLPTVPFGPRGSLPPLPFSAGRGSWVSRIFGRRGGGVAGPTGPLRVPKDTPFRTGRIYGPAEGETAPRALTPHERQTLREWVRHHPIRAALLPLSAATAVFFLVKELFGQAFANEWAAKEGLVEQTMFALRQRMSAYRQKPSDDLKIIIENDFKLADRYIPMAQAWAARWSALNPTTSAQWKAVIEMWGEQLESTRAEWKAILAAESGPVLPRRWAATVGGVIDGDTLYLTGDVYDADNPSVKIKLEAPPGGKNVTIRLVGVNAAETRAWGGGVIGSIVSPEFPGLQWVPPVWADAAKKRLSALKGKKVIITIDPLHPKDSPVLGRYLGVVSVNGKDVALDMLDEGLLVIETVAPNAAVDRDVYLQHTLDAQAKGKGLWAGVSKSGESHAPSTAGVWIQSDPSGGIIYIDGEQTAFKTPKMVDMVVGQHRIDVWKGNVTAGAVVNVAAKGNVPVTVKLPMPEKAKAGKAAGVAVGGVAQPGAAGGGTTMGNPFE